MDGFHYSLDLGLNRLPTLQGPVHNLQKARHHPDVAQCMIDEEVAKGHMLGPFTEPPFPNMVFSPINLVPKAGSEGKLCLIHDLSYPYNEESVNVINFAIHIGPTAVACRLDIHAAYRNAPLNYHSIIVLGPAPKGKQMFTYSFPLINSSSCTIFERIVTIIEWIVKFHRKIRWLKHYLDDYIMLTNSLTALVQQMQKVTDIMIAIGMPLAEEKTLGPRPIKEFLGMVLNFLQQLLQIPDKKKEKCLHLLTDMVQKYHAREKSQYVKYNGL